jgi:hypothetical protein
VFAAEGIYEEELTAGVSLFGGYEWPTWSRDISTYTTTINGTLELGGNLAVQGFTIEGEAAKEDGFRVNVTPEANVSFVENILIGGAYDCFWAEGPSTIVDNAFTGGEDEYNTGIMIVDSRANILNNRIEAAPGQDLCGIDIAGSKAWIKGNTYTGSEDEQNSVGILVGEGEADIEENIIHIGMGGESGSSSSGVLLLRSKADLRNNEINCNWSTEDQERFIGIGLRNSTALLIDNRLSMQCSGSNVRVTMINLYEDDNYEPNNLVAINNLLVSSGGYRSVGLGNDGESSNSITLINNLIHISDAKREYGISSGPGIEANLINNIFILEPSAESESIIGIYKTEMEGDIRSMNNDIDTDSGPLLQAGEIVKVDYPHQLDECQWPGCLEASGNISANPRWNGSGDYHLAGDSPCIDAGTDPSTWYAGQEIYLDFEGDARPYGAGWDMGPDEWSGQTND